MKNLFTACSLFFLLGILNVSAEGADVSKFAYVNEDYQIALDYPAEWKLYTEPKQAPTFFAPLLANKETNLIQLLGQFKNQEVFTRLIVQKYTDEVSNLKANIDAMFESVKLPISKKFFDVDQYLYYIEYTTIANGVKIKFCEFITQSNEYLVRMGFWTLEQNFDKHLDEFFKIMEDSKYLSKTDAGTEWVPLWTEISLAKGEQASPKDVTDYPGYVQRDQRKYLGYTIKGAKNKVHIIGSIHLGRDDFYPMTQKIEDAFNSSKNVVFEVNENSPESQAAVGSMQARMTLPAGKTLKSVLGPETYAFFDAYCKKNGVDLSLYSGFQPWAVVLVVVQQVYMQNGLAGENGVEKYFQSKMGDKKILDLETLESQIQLFESMDVATLIKGSVDEEKGVTNQIGQITEAWLKGDEKAMETLFLSTDPSVAKYMKTMIDDRNINMAKKIEDYLKQGEDYFVVVGAGHVIGPNGLVNLLKKKGFKIDRL